MERKKDFCLIKLIELGTKYGDIKIFSWFLSSFLKKHKSFVGVDKMHEGQCEIFQLLEKMTSVIFVFKLDIYLISEHINFA